MEDLIIFRIFLAFPLIGLLLPDTGMLLLESNTNVSASHVIIDVTLLISILVCSAGILYIKRKNSIIDDAAIRLNNETLA